jgi:hypothetical protein
MTTYRIALSTSALDLASSEHHYDASEAIKLVADTIVAPDDGDEVIVCASRCDSHTLTVDYQYAGTWHRWADRPIGQALSTALSSVIYR